MPQLDFWRQFTSLSIWKMAALMDGVDPRALGDIVDRDGHCIDLSDEEDKLKSAVLTQDILSIPANNVAPDQYTVISVSSTLHWLRRIGLSALADELDTTQSPIVQAAAALTAVTQPTPTESLRNSSGPGDTKNRSKFTMKRSAMVTQHQQKWPTIERDLKDAKRNGLSNAALGEVREWNEKNALEWARLHDKLLKPLADGDPLTTAMTAMSSLPVTRHTLQG